MTPEQKQKRTTLFTHVVLLTALYFLGGLLGKAALFGSGKYELVWPPFGIGLAALLLYGKRYAFGIALGSLFYAFLNGLPLGVLTLGVMLGNTVGALLGVYLLERFVHFDKSLGRIQDVAGLAGLACFFGAMLTALFQGVAEVYSGTGGWVELFPASLAWWVPNAMAGLVITPFFLCWASPAWGKWSWVRWLEALVCAAGLVAGTWISFQSWFAYGVQNYPMALLPYPFLAWASVRFGLRGAATGTLLVATLSIHALLAGRGPFVAATEQGSVLLIGSYLAILSFTNLMLAAAVAERRVAEATLRKSQEMWNLITNNVTDLIAVTDTNGKRLYNSASYWGLLGNPDRLPGTDAFKEIHPDDRQRVKEVFQKSLCERKGQRLEFRFLLQDGRLRHIESLGSYVLGEFGQPGRIVTVARDITDRKQIEQQLRKLSCAIEQSPVAVVITDTEGRIEYVNPKFVQLTGYTAEEVAGQNPRLLKSGEAPAGLYQELWQSLKSGREWRGQLHNRNKSGALFWVAATLSPIFSPAGEVTHFLAIEEDITDRKNDEMIKTHLEGKLRQALKMEAIGTLAGGIAHDFNHLLGSILGYTELALKDLGENKATTQEHLKSVVLASQSAKELIRQILTFGRQHPEERKPLQLQPVIREALKLMRPTLPPTIEILPRIQDDAPGVLANTIQMHQVVMNLCTNAVHSMLEGQGRLEVSLEAVTVDETLVRQNPELCKGPYVRLTVKDNGQGMTTEVLKRIFNPFFTTKAPGKGTGLGLSVIHGIVKDHEGAIQVESQPGRGTTFQVFFPVYEHTPLATQTAPLELLRGQGQRILFVDDEPMLCNMAQIMLENLGYQATSQEDPLQALELFRAQPDSFDLVITDLTMPKLNGTDLAARLLETRPGMPVLLMTGFSATWNRENVRSLGLCDLLQKPFTHESLGKILHRIFHPVRTVQAEGLAGSKSP
jgi:PAS domain S-box-containing protein